MIRTLAECIDVAASARDQNGVIQGGLLHATEAFKSQVADIDAVGKWLGDFVDEVTSALPDSELARSAEASITRCNTVVGAAAGLLLAIGQANRAVAELGAELEDFTEYLTALR